MYRTQMQDSINDLIAGRPILIFDRAVLELENNKSQWYKSFMQDDGLCNHIAHGVFNEMCDSDINAFYRYVGQASMKYKNLVN